MTLATLSSMNNDDGTDIEEMKNETINKMGESNDGLNFSGYSPSRFRSSFKEMEPNRRLPPIMKFEDADKKAPKSTTQRWGTQKAPNFTQKNEQNQENYIVNMRIVSNKSRWWLHH